MRYITAITAFCLLLWATVVAAQQETATDQTPQPDLQEVASSAPATDTWRLVAERAERMTETGDASQFALRTIRAELVEWRSVHRADLALHSGRLATVAAQLNALGPAPEGDDDPEIAMRRAALVEQNQRLQSPQILAQEAFARANGLIAEIDSLVRTFEANQIMRQGPSPLNLTNWSNPITAVSDGVRIIATETAAALAVFLANGQILNRILIVLVGLVWALFFCFPVRSVLVKFSENRKLNTGILGRLAGLALSLLGIVFPIAGLTGLIIALHFSGFVGISGQEFVNTLPEIGAIVLIGKWLVDRFFSLDPMDDGPLGYALETRIQGRSAARWLAWLLVAWIILRSLTLHATEATLDLIEFPFILASCWFLWKLGRAVSSAPRFETKALFTRGYLRNFMGRAAQIIAVAGPIFAAFGYVEGASAIVGPTIYSFAIIGFVVILQQLVHVGSAPVSPAQISDTDHASQSTTDESVAAPLFPVLVSFGLVLLSLPVLALVWGVHLAELIEIWTAFTEGFSLGETRISPTIFATLLLVFGIGYALTRFIKGTLKTSVLPRTRMDLGGQNAVVAGFGYVGIMLSALVALSVAGIDLSSLAIVAGALSVGIGFGLQNIVSNFVSGIILLIERPISEGDMIEVNGQMGFVRDISVRSTRIETFDRTDVIVPNADLVSGVVTNWTRGNLVGRTTVPIGVAYGSDTAKITAILREIAQGNPMVLMNPPPAILLMGLGADSIDFEIRAIIRDVNFVHVVKSEILHAVIARFAEEGVEIPFAQRDIWLRNPEVLNVKGGAE